MTRIDLIPITIAKVSDLVTDMIEGLMDMRMPVRMMIVKISVSCVQCILFLKEVEKKGPRRNPDTLFLVSCIRFMMIERGAVLLLNRFSQSRLYCSYENVKGGWNRQVEMCNECRE